MASRKNKTKQEKRKNMIKPIKQNEKKYTAKKKAVKLGVKPRPSARKVGY